MQMDMVPRLCRQTDILYYSQLDGNCKYIGYETRNRGEKSFTPVIKSSIFQKTEQTTTVNDAMETKIEIGICEEKTNGTKK